MSGQTTTEGLITRKGNGEDKDTYQELLMKLAPKKSPAMSVATFLNTKVSLLLYSSSSKMSPFLNLSINQMPEIEFYSNVTWAMPQIISHGLHIFDNVIFLFQ